MDGTNVYPNLLYHDKMELSALIFPGECRWSCDGLDRWGTLTHGEDVNELERSHRGPSLGQALNQSYE
jgi:hypothetical protein